MAGAAQWRAGLVMLLLFGDRTGGPKRRIGAPAQRWGLGGWGLQSPHVNGACARALGLQWWSSVRAPLPQAEGAAEGPAKPALDLSLGHIGTCKGGEVDVQEDLLPGWFPWALSVVLALFPLGFAVLSVYLMGVK